MTIKEIARLCNVSPATVSNVINGKGRIGKETVERIQAIIAETGYEPSYLGKGLRSQSTRMIGVVADDIGQFTVPRVIDGVMACCEEQGYHIILENLRLYNRWSDTWFGDEEKYQSVLQPALARMRHFQVEGILYIGGHERVVHGIDQSRQIPTVVAYAFPNDPQVPAYVLDDETGGYMAAKYLLKQGHRRIGYIAAERENQHVVDRVRGYHMALEEAGVSLDPALEIYGHWGRESGYDIVPRMIGAGATAVLCAGDRIAGGVYDYLMEKGMVPGRELSVVGYDNMDISAYFRPGLTTVSMPLYEIGYLAAEGLMRLIGGHEPKTGEVVRVPGELIVRDSVGSPIYEG